MSGMNVGYYVYCSVSPGSRFLNFAWYAPLDVSELPSILTSTSGHLHRWSVPRGELRSDVWSVQTRRASSRLSPAFAELISAVDEPFVQVISDCRSARAVFAGGRILLVGDALSMIRPHTGKGVSFAASQVLGLEDWVKGKKDLAEWERNVVDGGWLGVLESRSWAAYYMGGSLEWAVSALKYRIAVKWVELKKWWRSRL
ncbi:MAG: hypothetical protein LQ340_000314 [Diploschistes diacapsis]|nr:MAG: hypothetical protein LQ340_000314 [Diploschistes diacapsis]